MRGETWTGLHREETIKKLLNLWMYLYQHTLFDYGMCTLQDLNLRLPAPEAGTLSDSANPSDLLRGLAKPILAPLSSVPLVGIEPTQLAPEASTLFDFAHP